MRASIPGVQSAVEDSMWHYVIVGVRMYNSAGGRRKNDYLDP